MKSVEWLKSLNDREFEKVMIFADKKINRLSGLAIQELIEEFERRKYLDLGRMAGLAIYVSSMVLKKKTDLAFGTREKEYFYTVDDLKELLKKKVVDKFPEKREKRIDYIKELQKIAKIKLEPTEYDIEELYEKSKRPAKIMREMMRTKVFKPFNDFLPKDITRDELKDILLMMTYAILHMQLKVEGKEIDGILYLKESFVRGTK